MKEFACDSPEGEVVGSLGRGVELDIQSRRWCRVGQGGLVISRQVRNW